MMRLTIIGIIACVGLFIAPAAVIGAGPPDGLNVNVLNTPLPVSVSTTAYQFVGFAYHTGGG